YLRAEKCSPRLAAGRTCSPWTSTSENSKTTGVRSLCSRTVDSERTTMTSLNVVSLSASPHEPSKTTALLDAIVTEFSGRLEVGHRRILMSDIASDLGRSLSRGGVGALAADALHLVEACDLLVVTTPIYRATYTGLFKHFFDLVGQDELVGTPVFL